jgi:hypothetical protein
VTIPASAPQVEVPESWAPIIKPASNNANRTVTLTYYDTQLVSTGRHHDKRLGPWPFPTNRGNLSTALLQAVQSSGQELWPDWERESIPDPVHTACSVISAVCLFERINDEMCMGTLLRARALKGHCRCRLLVPAVNLSSLHQDGSWEHGTRMETKDIGMLIGLMP